MVAPNVTQFNILRLTPSTGTSTGTILEFDLARNILPTAGTYKTVSAIDTAIAAINVPYAMSWLANSEYTYDGRASKPLPSRTPSVLVILPTCQPSQLGHVQPLACGTLLLLLASL